MLIIFTFLHLLSTWADYEMKLLDLYILSKRISFLMTEEVIHMDPFEFTLPMPTEDCILSKSVLYEKLVQINIISLFALNRKVHRSILERLNELKDQAYSI